MTRNLVPLGEVRVASATTVDGSGISPARLPGWVIGCPIGGVWLIAAVILVAPLWFERDLGNRVHLPDNGHERFQVRRTGGVSVGVRSIPEDRSLDFDRDRRVIEVVSLGRKLRPKERLE